MKHTDCSVCFWRDGQECIPANKQTRYVKPKDCLNGIMVEEGVVAMRNLLSLIEGGERHAAIQGRRCRVAHHPR